MYPQFFWKGDGSSFYSSINWTFLKKNFKKKLESNFHTNKGPTDFFENSLPSEDFSKELFSTVLNEHHHYPPLPSPIS